MMKNITVTLCVLAIGAWFYFVVSVAKGDGKPHRVRIGCPAHGNPNVTTKDPKTGVETTTTVSFEDAGDGDIDGDGKADLRAQSETDEEGNSIECWCLQSSEKHIQRIYCLHIYKNGTKEWFGGCYFPDAQNDLKPLGAEPSKKRGVDWKKIGTVTHDNIEKKPPGSGSAREAKPGEKISDYHFEHAVDGRCYSVETLGSWMFNGNRKWQYIYDIVQGTEQVYPCPEAPQGVDHPEGAHSPPIMAPPTPQDMPTMQAALSLVWDIDDLPTWRYTIQSSGIHQECVPGDTLWIWADGVEEAFVGEPASTPEFGGWILDDVTPDGVSYVATTRADIVDIGPFELVSKYPLAWTRFAYGGKETGSAGSCSGPVSPAFLTRRWDVDLNGRVEITDPIRIIGFLFTGGQSLACPSNADANTDGRLDISDAVMVLMWMFTGGEGPTPQFTDDC